MQRREFIGLMFGWGAVCSMTGCGTFLHSERCHVPHSNQIDWKIAALDGLGLLLFFVPGVVAFIVDFSTGAIYLPLETYYPVYGGVQPPPPSDVKQEPTPLAPAPANATSATPQQPRTWQELGLTRVMIPREELKPQRIEEVVTQHTGQTVSLSDSQARLSTLTSIDHFDEQANHHRSDRNFGVAVHDFFARLMPA